MEIILYEDDAVSGLYPVTLTRPAFDIRTAGYTLEEAVRMVFPKAYISFKEAMHTSNLQVFINARHAPDLSILEKLASLLPITGRVCINEKRDGCETVSLPWKLFSHPEDIVFFNRDSLKKNLEIAAKNLRRKEKGLYVAKGVELPKQFAYETKHGPIVICEGVTISPFTVLKGPLIIREHATVKEFSTLEGSTIGPVCKVGGEVTGSVIDGYSNKQHLGFLGDSYIGRWVNMGAGTSVSDLKNTYSNISIGGRDSGSQFLGVIFGDYVKTAINASVFCGKIIGTSAHLYGTVTSDVPSFTSHVSASSLYELPLAVAEKSQKAMAARRMVTWTDTDTKRLETVFEMTKGEREEKKVSKDKLSF